LTELEQEGLDYRRRYQGLIGIGSKVPIRDRAILSLVSTPGVAEACLAINEDPLASFDLTCRGNTVAILTDGSDIFGRESGPPEAAIPLEEAKSVIFKTFAGVDAFPLSLATSDPDRIVETGLALSSTFGAICLDDISAPRAFTIADNLENGADIPVFSNQHHGTAILVLGGLANYWGVAFGAIIMWTILEGTRFVDLPISAEREAAVRFMIVGLVLILLMAFRPQGVFGKKEEMVLGD